MDNMGNAGITTGGSSIPWSSQQARGPQPGGGDEGPRLSQQVAVRGQKDSYAPAGKDRFAPTQRDIEAGLKEKAKRQEIVDSMIARDTRLGAPDEKSAQALKGALAKVDTDVLSYAKQNGAKLVIVKDGQSLLDAGVIRSQDPAAVTEQAAALAPQARETVRGAEARFGPGIEAMKKELAKYGARPSGYGDNLSKAMSKASDGDVEKISTLYGDLRRAQSDEKAMIEKGLEKSTSDKVKIFTPGEAAGVDSNMFSDPRRMSAMMPQTPDQMAQIHGAKTPEEVRRFSDSVEALNADRLPKMRQQTISELEKVASEMKDPKMRQNYTEIIGKLKENPRYIPLDHVNNPVLVPNQYYYRSGDRPDAPPVSVDQHDMMTLGSWNDGSGTIKSSDPQKSAGRVVMGQHFAKDGMNTVVLRKEALEGRAPIHELGHAIEATLAKTRPDLAPQLEADRQKAFSHLAVPDQEGAAPGTHRPISDYALTNGSENHAEGLSFYYEDPKLLKRRDPELFALVAKEESLIKAQMKNR